MIALMLTHLLGIYLALLLAFNKGFAYTFTWIGPFPLFISEFVLFVMAIVFVVGTFLRKWRFDKQDLWVCVPLVLLWIAGIVGIWPLWGESGGEVIDTLKRSALAYYSLFAFLAYSMVRDPANVRRLFLWMLAGGIISFIANGLTLFPWWPHYAQAGIAAITSAAFVAIYSFYRKDEGARSWLFCIAGATGAMFVLYSTIRSTAIASTLVFLTTLALLLAHGYPRAGLRHLVRYAALALIELAVCMAIWGPPPSIGRYQRLLVRQEKTPSVPVEIMETKKAPSPRLAHPLPVATKPPAPKQAVTKVSANPVPVISVTEEKKGRFTASLQKRLAAVLYNNFEAGNVSWRLNIWLDGIQQVVDRNIFFGIGFREPFIVQSMNPFTDPDRYRQAINGMKKVYDFKSRITDPNRSPSDDVVPRPPIAMNPEEITRVVSHHWYSIDFHNSHVAIFFRMGLVGLSGFLLLNLVFLVSVWNACRRGDPLTFFAATYWVWYMMAAASNVVLEGPFMAVPYWIFIGVMLRYAKEQKNLVEEKPCPPQPRT